MDNESSTSNPYEIMKELRSFYSDLYKKSINEESETLTDVFMRDLHLPKLTLDQLKDVMKNYRLENVLTL